MESGKLRDSATERLVDQVADRDPEVSLRMGPTATKPELQADMLHNVFEQWMETDPAAARNHREKTPIPEEHRERLSEIFSDSR